MKGMFKKLSLVAMVLLLFNVAKAQYFSVGEEPTSVKWERMNSKNFSLIIPKNYKNYSIKWDKRYLDMMEQHYGIFADTIKYNYGLSKRFPMVVHPFNAQSNGFTLWAPRQIGYYPMYYTGISYPQNWMEQLVLHEGRHAWQLAHFNRGFWKVLYALFGDQAIGAASGIYPSTWMLEGDAVVAETERSDFGRGRNGDFLDAILQCIQPADGEHQTSYGKNRSWDRWRFGSVKHFSPSPYEVGYLINSMARYVSGDYYLTHKILNMEALQPLNANIVANAFERYTGHTHKEFISGDYLQKFYELNVNKKFNQFLEKYHSEPENISAGAGDRAGANRGYYTNFYNVVEVGDNKLIAGVEGYGSEPYLVLFEKKNGKWESTKLRSLPSSQSGFSTDGRKIYWSEPIGDARWEQVCRNKIFSYDLEDRKLERIKVESDYLYSPMVCRDTLYAIEYTPGMEKSRIVRIKKLSEDKLLYGGEQSVVCEIDGQITEICNSEGKIYFTHIEDGGISIYRADYSPTRITLPIKHAIKEIIGSGDRLYFLTDYFGGDALCSIKPNVEDCQIEKIMKIVTPTREISTFDYNSEKKELYMTKKEEDWGAFLFTEKIGDFIDIDPSDEFEYPLAQELSRQYKASPDYKAISEYKSDSLSFEKKNHSKWNLFKIHSWAPIYAQVSGETSASYDEFVSESEIGATIFSQNTLGTAFTSLGYSYRRDRDYSKNLHAAHATFSYSGLYPVIEASAHFNDEVMLEKNKKSFTSTISTYIPWNFSRHGWLKGITPQISWNYKNYEEILITKVNSLGEEYYDIKQIDRHQVVAGISAYDMRPVAKAQFFPRLGVGGRFMSGFNPAGGENFGSIYLAYLYGYLPGVTFNQSLRFSFAYQWQNPKKYLMDNLISEPRGYTEDIYSKKAIKATLDYAIPIYLGDVSLGPIAYLKRVNIVPFADLGLFKRPLRDGNKWRNRSSFGADIIFDTHLFRIGYPISIGLRYARTNKPAGIGGVSTSSFEGKNRRDYFSLILEISVK